MDIIHLISISICSLTSPTLHRDSAPQWKHWTGSQKLQTPRRWRRWTGIPCCKATWPSRILSGGAGCWRTGSLWILGTLQTASPLCDEGALCQWIGRRWSQPQWEHRILAAPSRENKCGGKWSWGRRQIWAFQWREADSRTQTTAKKL